MLRRPPNMSEPPIDSDAWKTQDKGPSIIATCWAVTAASTVFVGARLYVRGVILKRLHSDDYYSLLALVSVSLFCSAIARNLHLTLHLDQQLCYGSFVDSSSGIFRQWKTYCPPYNGATTRRYLLDYSILLYGHYNPRRSKTGCRLATRTHPRSGPVS